MRQCISTLRTHRVHPYFPAYLHLRQRASLQGRTDNVRPNWNELSAFLQVGGAPSTHPHFRPFTQSESEGDDEWLNANLAGSYAPSSLRAGQRPLRVVEIAEKPGCFNLRPEHWKLAREHLLDGKKLPIDPLAGFFLRDHALLDLENPPNFGDLRAAFAEAFGYDDESGAEEIDHLYDLTPVATGSWFIRFIRVGEDDDER